MVALRRPIEIPPRINVRRMYIRRMDVEKYRRKNVQVVNARSERLEDSGFGPTPRAATCVRTCTAHSMSPYHTTPYVVPGHVASFTKILNAIMAKYRVGEMRLMKLPEKLDN